MNSGLTVSGVTLTVLLITEEAGTDSVHAKDLQTTGSSLHWSFAFYKKTLYGKTGEANTFKVAIIGILFLQECLISAK